MAKKPLEVGQRVWIETISIFLRDKERKVQEYEIVEANKSSAYALNIKYLKEYEKDSKKYNNLKRRIVQRTHEGIGNGLGDRYRLWLTKEEFEENVTYSKELSETKKEVMELVNRLTLKEMQEIQKKYG